MSAKKLALELEPRLRGFTDSTSGKNKYGVKLDLGHRSEIIGNLESNPSTAWQHALEYYQNMQFKAGDLVVMVNCIEASNSKNINRIFRCRADAFKAASNDWGVFLENYSGYFLCKFLRKATEHETILFNTQNSFERS